LSHNMARYRTPWYVLQLKPGGFEAALVNLARQKYETLMPRVEITRRTSRGMRTTKRPLFPGYLFFSAPDHNINWTSVRSTRGVSRVLTHSGGAAAHLPQALAEELLSATDSNGDLHALPDLEPGDVVSVINGPMTGMTARIVALGEYERVRLLVELMGRSVRVDVAQKDLERA